MRRGYSAAARYHRKTVAIVTLTTDFGLLDPYVGLMKGVILSLAPGTRIVDLAHGVPPQDVLAGAMVLDSAFGCFPDGTIHVVVVDPGVGTDRQAVCLRTQHACLIAPDNGVLSAFLQRDRFVEGVRLSNPKFHREPVSATFHGRDIFAPAAGHLAAGVPLYELGDPITGVLHLPIPEPTELPDGNLELHILQVDGFGNLITDLTRDAFDNWRSDRRNADPSLILGTTRLDVISRTYSDVAEGQLVAYFGSTDRLEIAVRNANASQTLDLHRGGVVRLEA